MTLDNVKHAKCPEQKSEKSGNTEVYFTHIHPRTYCIKKLPSILIWLASVGILFFFSHGVLDEYLQMRPITIITSIKPPEVPDPVVIKLCHSVLFDPAKIQDYNNSNLDQDTYNFLQQSVKNNVSYDDREFVSAFPANSLFLLSSETFYDLRLEPKQFIISCGNWCLYNDSCIESFKWHLLPSEPCYQATISLAEYGNLFFVNMLFYLDPRLSFGKYTERRGIYVGVFHPDEHRNRYQSFFLAPKQTSVVALKPSLKFQKSSFTRSKCVHTYGLQMHNFTGEVFAAPHNVDSCRDICIAKAYYERCNCTPLVGWNITKTECLHDREKRKCILEIFVIYKQFHSENVAPCLSKCIDKCVQNRFELDIFKAELNLHKQAVLEKLETAAVTSNQSILAGKLLEEMRERNYSSGATKDVADNLAELSVYFEPIQEMKKTETILLMSGSTFVSNIGGLVGMLLGLSAVSVLEFLEKLMLKLLTNN